MRHRRWAMGMILIALTLGISPALSAQTPARRVIDITLQEYEYRPSQIRFNEGETVVLRLNNVGPRFVHNISTRYWLNIPLTLRGDVRQGVSEERRWVALDAGKSGEVEFVAQGRGSFAILCSIFDHASRGHTGAFFVQPAGSP